MTFVIMTLVIVGAIHEAKQISIFTSGRPRCGLDEHTSVMRAGRAHKCHEGWTSTQVSCGLDEHTSVMRAGRAHKCHEGWTSTQVS